MDFHCAQTSQLLLDWIFDPLCTVIERGGINPLCPFILILADK